MGRPVKWSRDLHAIRERATSSRTETYGRSDIERLFDVSRVSAQSLMKAIGEVQPVGSAHFIERTSLLAFLDAMINAPSVDEAFRQRVFDAAPAPSTAPLRITEHQLQCPPSKHSRIMRTPGDHLRHSCWTLRKPRHPGPGPTK
jgi:hypothetical protein